MRWIRGKQLAHSENEIEIRFPVKGGADPEAEKQLNRLFQRGGSKGCGLPEIRKAPTVFF
jgi:hypothetical protein